MHDDYDDYDNIGMGLAVIGVLVFVGLMSVCFSGEPDLVDALVFFLMK